MLNYNCFVRKHMLYYFFYLHVTQGLQVVNKGQILWLVVHQTRFDLLQKQCSIFKKILKNSIFLQDSIAPVDGLSHLQNHDFNDSFNMMLEIEWK